MAEEIREAQEETAGSDFDAAFDEASARQAGDMAHDVPAPQDDAAQPETHDDDAPPENGAKDAGEEGAGQGAEDYRHKFDSAMGRLKASQRENRELAEELARLKRQVEGMAQKADAGDSGEGGGDGGSMGDDMPGLEDVPEELRALFHEDSADGRRLRKMAEEYGADYAIPIAETIRERKDFQKFRAGEEEERRKRAEDEFKASVARAVPEFSDAIVGEEREEKFRELVSGVNAWIDLLPYAEGREMSRIASEGTADEVIAMLRKYSRYRSQGRKSAVRDLARANMAVPAGRSSAPPMDGKISKDDFDSAFEEFSR